MVRPSAASARIVSQNSCRAPTSMPVVGSSRTTRSGSGSRASANFNRCCSPPEQASTRRAGRSVRPARSSTTSTRSDRPCRAAIARTVSPTVKSLSRPPVCMTADTSPCRTASAGDRRRRPRPSPRSAPSGRAACRRSWSCRHRWGRGTPRSRRAGRSGRRRRPRPRSLPSVDRKVLRRPVARIAGRVQLASCAPACAVRLVPALAELSRPARDTCHRADTDRERLPAGTPPMPATQLEDAESGVQP